MICLPLFLRVAINQSLTFQKLSKREAQNNKREQKDKGESEITKEIFKTTEEQGWNSIDRLGMI